MCIRDRSGTPFLLLGLDLKLPYLCLTSEVKRVFVSSFYNYSSTGILEIGCSRFGFRVGYVRCVCKKWQDYYNWGSFWYKILGLLRVLFFGIRNIAKVWYLVYFGSFWGLSERHVGRTHTIVRLQTRTRRKDGTENFGGFVYVLDGFLQREFVLWVFMCSIYFSVSFPATTLKATTPHRNRTGYHAQGHHAFTTTARLLRLCVYIPAVTP